MWDKLIGEEQEQESLPPFEKSAMNNSDTKEDKCIYTDLGWLTYKSSCGSKFAFDGPISNEYKYCIFCGKGIEFED